MNHQTYTEFFREIARRHKEILHSPAEMHFARLILERDPFASSSAQISEFIENVKSSLHSPAMLLAAYGAQYSDQRGDNIEKILSGRLIILEEVERNNYDAEEAALSKTERIGEECLGFADHYFSNHPEEGFFEWSGAASEKVSKITSRNFFGSAFDFSLKVSAHNSIYYNPQNFID